METTPHISPKADSRVVFVLLPVAKLHPTVAGSTFSIWGLFVPQLWATQPPYGKQGFAYSIMTLTLRL